MRSVNEKGVALIKRFEGCRLKAYQCEAGKWTIGYGSTEGIRPGMSISQETAERLLQHELQRFSSGVSKLLKVKVTDDQFAALVSLAYNIGIPRFAASTLLRLLNSGDLPGAANQFGAWRLVTNPVTGVKEISMNLVKRREIERRLFLGTVARANS